MNANVKAALWFYGISNLGVALTGTVDSNALYALMGANLWVGVAEGLQGLMILLVAIPAGIHADRPRVSQARMLRTAMYASWVIAAIECLPLVAILVCQGDSSDTCFAPPEWLHEALSTARAQYTWFMVVLALSGAQIGFSEPALEALFANSMSDGAERTKILGRRYMIGTVASIIGPASTLCMFWFLGDEWSLDTMAIVWLVGLAIVAVSGVFLGRFRDTSVLSALLLSEDDHDKLFPAHDVVACKNASVNSLPPPPRLDYGSSSSSSLFPRRQDSEDPADEQHALPLVNNNSRSEKVRIRWIPYCCLTSNVIVAIGSGMTVKFWGLFYQHEIRFSPVAVNLVYMGQGVLLAATVAACERLRTRLGVGRLRLGLASMFLGLATLASVAAFRDLWQSQPWMVACLLMARMALMNGPSSVFAAILTDHIAEDARSRWSSLESITTVGWCGSAALGGWLCDTYGYGVTFWITFGLQTFGTLLMLPTLRHEV